MSVSATTRPIRPGEVDGVDYHFVDLERFREMVAAGEFLEWAHVFGHRYGTPHEPVEKALSEGRDVLFDIDWQGAQQLFQQAGGDVVRVFIFPPSLAELERRLRATPESVRAVMQRHDRSVAVLFLDGRRYHGTEPTIDAIIALLRTVDPSGRILIATE